jgi:excinuclease ABC subunit B
MPEPLGPGGGGYDPEKRRGRAGGRGKPAGRGKR